MYPHAGDWRTADVSLHSTAWNEPLRAVHVSRVPQSPASLFGINQDGYEIMTCYVDGNDTYVRIANTGLGNPSAEMQINGLYNRLQWVELDGRSSEAVQTEKGKVQLPISPFGFKTLRIANFRAK